MSDANELKTMTAFFRLCALSASPQQVATLPTFPIPVVCIGFYEQVDIWNLCPNFNDLFIKYLICSISGCRNSNILFLSLSVHHTSVQTEVKATAGWIQNCT